MSTDNLKNVIYYNTQPTRLSRKLKNKEVDHSLEDFVELFSRHGDVAKLPGVSCRNAIRKLLHKQI